MHADQKSTSASVSKWNSGKVNSKTKNVKVHPPNFEKVFNGIERKLGQSSVNGLPNNSSSVDPLPLLDIMEVDSLRGKTFW